MVFGLSLAWARTGTSCEDVSAQRRLRCLSMAPLSPQGITCVRTRPNGSARLTVVMKDTRVNGLVWPCLGDGCHGQQNVLRRIQQYPIRAVRATVLAIPMPNTIGWHEWHERLQFYQEIRRSPFTTSKWRSRLINGRACSRQRDAIHTSLLGMGVPAFFNSAQRPA